jgi:hypothetical protein
VIRAMNVQFNDEIVFKKMAATGLDCIFDGKINEAEYIFTAVLTIMPEHRASLLGMALVNASSKILTTDRIKGSISEANQLETDNFIIQCIQALALLQRNEVIYANELLEGVIKHNDPISSALAKTIIKNEIRGII